MAVKVFTDDRNYTYESLIVQLNVLELDLRDGYYKRCASVPEKMLNQLALLELHDLDRSNRECVCSNSKHIPALLGLARDGIKQATIPRHKEVLGAIQADALAYKRRMDEGQLSEDEMAQFSDWMKEAVDEINKMGKEWSACEINTGDYVTRISGLAGEAIGFTNDNREKQFMTDLRDNARSYMYRINSSEISRQEAESIREWAREMRRRITGKIWVGDLPSSSRKDEEKKHKENKQKVKAVEKDEENCPTCTLVPEKYRKKKAEEDYRYVSVDDGAGGLKGIDVPKQESNQDIRWINR